MNQTFVKLFRKMFRSSWRKKYQGFTSIVSETCLHQKGFKKCDCVQLSCDFIAFLFSFIYLYPLYFHSMTTPPPLQYSALFSIVADYGNLGDNLMQGVQLCFCPLLSLVWFHISLSWSLFCSSISNLCRVYKANRVSPLLTLPRLFYFPS